MAAMTWRQRIEELMLHLNDPGPITHIQAGGRDVAFEPDYFGPHGVAFTAWTDTYVYFPAHNDGYEWVTFVPRNPCAFAKTHVGGG